MNLPTNHSKIAHKLVFNFHSDPGHGWLAVKKNLIRELGLVSEISKYSYMQGQSVYLEEDSDATKFLKRFQEVFGITARVKELESKNRSSAIRSMNIFSIDE